MLTTCACVAIVRMLQTEVVIPVQFRRPSVLLTELQPNGIQAMFPNAVIKTDDIQSRIVVTGSREDVEGVRRVVQLFDAPRQRIQVQFEITSKIDHSHYRVDAEVYSQEPWTTEDPELGLKLSLTPRLNADGTSTFKVVADYQGRETKETFRLKSGGRLTIPFPVARLTSAVQDGGPLVEFRYTGTRGD